MKSSWSNTWKKSVQPRKQRKYIYNAPLHLRRKFVSAHLSPQLRKKFNRRAMPLRKGDEVKVMRGSKKGTKGKISEVDLKRLVVFIDGQLREKVTGTKVPIPFKASNLMITDLKLDDKKRAKILKVKPTPKVEEKTEEKKEEKTPPSTPQPPAPEETPAEKEKKSSKIVDAIKSDLKGEKKQ